MEFTFLKNALFRRIFTHVPPHSKLAPKLLSSRPALVTRNKLEALDFKIAQGEESQDFISKEYEAQKATINEIQKKNKYLEGENSLLHKE